MKGRYLMENLFAPENLYKIAGAIHKEIHEIIDGINGIIGEIIDGINGIIEEIQSNIPPIERPEGPAINVGEVLETINGIIAGLPPTQPDDRPESLLHKLVHLIEVNQEAGFPVDPGLTEDQKDQIIDAVDDLLNNRPVDPGFEVNPIEMPGSIVDNLVDLIEDQSNIGFPLPPNPELSEQEKENIIDAVEDIINGQPVDPDFGIDLDNGINTGDNDGDGIPDINDSDDNGDGISDHLQEPTDSDSDVSFPGNSEDGDGDQSTIDDQPIDPDDSAPDNVLRKISIEQSPVAEAFDERYLGSSAPDKLNGGSSDDELKGRNANDVIRSHKGNDYLFGGTGNDKLQAGAGSDVLQGQKGADLLDGYGGADLLYGGSGKDSLTGGAGSDIFVLSKGKDVVTDFKVAKDGIGLVHAVDLDVIQKGDDLLLKDPDLGVRMLLENVDRDEFLRYFPGNLQQVPAVEVDIF